MAKKDKSQEVEETKETQETQETVSPEKETKKEKMIEIQVNQTFGFRGQSYMAGQRYVVAKKDLPPTVNGKYEPYKGEKKSDKKNVPVVGK